MTISARLDAKTQLALTRYCKARGISKTQAIERGIRLLLEEKSMDKHPAYAAYLRLQSQLDAGSASRKTATSSKSLKEYLDEKYPG